MKNYMILGINIINKVFQELRDNLSTTIILKYSHLDRTKHKRYLWYTSSKKNCKKIGKVEKFKAFLEQIKFND